VTFMFYSKTATLYQILYQ